MSARENVKRGAAAGTGRAAPDRDLLICRCEEITLGEILDSIDEGITTPDGLKRRLRIGMGLCQGRTCRRLLQQVLAEHAGVSPADVRPATFRPPVRPVKISVLLDEREEPPPREQSRREAIGCGAGDEQPDRASPTPV